MPEEKSQPAMLSLDELILALEINAGVDSESIDINSLEYQAAQKLKETAKMTDRIGELEHMATHAKILAERASSFGSERSDIAARIGETL